MKFIKLTKLTKDLPVYVNIMYINNLQTLEEDTYNELKDKTITIRYTKVALTGTNGGENILVRESADDIIDMINNNLQGK